MRRASFLSLAVGSLAATLGPGLWGHVFGDPGVDRQLSRNRVPVEMPTEDADTFAFEPVDGWEVKMYYELQNPSCLVSKEGDLSPGPSLWVLRIRGVDAEWRGAERRSPVPVVSYEETLRYESAAYTGGRYKYLILLPERTIGGEHAVGVKYLYDDGKGIRALEEQYYVLRHDGMWNFSVQSGIYHDVIDPDTYRVLDGFHWTGPYVEPSAESSDSEDE